MKRTFIGILTVVTIAFFGNSQSSTNHIAKFDNFINPPNTFSSEKDLRDNLFVSESHEYEASRKKFFVCRSSAPSIGDSDDRVTCWYHMPNSDKLLRVWDVHLVGAGAIKFDYNSKTTRLSLIAESNIKVENNPFEGQPLASVVLTFLGTAMTAY